MLAFHPLGPDDRQPVQAVTFAAGLRNCNFTFANLLGWRHFFDTHVSILDQAVVFRYRFDNQPAYLLSLARPLSASLLEELRADARSLGSDLRITGLENDAANALAARFAGCATVEPMRDRYDYIYRRSDLADLQGKNLKNKRNHVNRFRALYPGFAYRDLEPALFDQCLRLERLWRETTNHTADDDTADMEQRVMEHIFANWERLDVRGGALFVDNQMVAFTYGAPVTGDTFDVCVEKADRRYEGAFSMINSQFALHLPATYRYLNREEDMGLPGLRKAKLSYHPSILLSFNSVIIPSAAPAASELLPGEVVLCRMTPADAEETTDWITRQYDFSHDEVADWVAQLHFNWPLSVKAVDNQGATVGLLNMSDYRIGEETPQMALDEPGLLARLDALRYVAVFSFIVAPPFRHTPLNYRMLMAIWPELEADCDFLFVPVMHRLATHSYWRRWGAVEFYRDGQSVYYMIPFSDEARALAATLPEPAVY